MNIIPELFKILQIPPCRHKSAKNEFAKKHPSFLFRLLPLKGCVLLAKPESWDPSNRMDEFGDR